MPGGGAHAQQDGEKEGQEKDLSGPFKKRPAGEAGLMSRGGGGLTMMIKVAGPMKLQMK